jgi:hypothetical protein
MSKLYNKQDGVTVSFDPETGKTHIETSQPKLSTFENVKSFNERWGKTPPSIGSDEYWLALENQLERIKEELEETILAVKERNMSEVLDGGCDMDVVVSGFNYLAGHDYEGAIQAVCDENHTKYTTDYDFAEETLETLYDVDNYDITIVEEGANVYYSVHRISDNKVCKLIGHPKVDLSSFIKS